MTYKPDTVESDPKAASRQQSSETAMSAAAREQAPLPKDASDKDKISRVVDDWVRDIRSNANPISRTQEGSNFLFEQASSLKAALSKAL